MSDYVYKVHKRNGVRALCRESSAREFSDNADDVTCRGCLELLGVVFTCARCKTKARGPRAWFEHVQTHCECPTRERAYRMTRRPPRYHHAGCPALDVARAGGR